MTPVVPVMHSLKRRIQSKLAAPGEKLEASFDYRMMSTKRSNDSTEPPE